MASSILKIIRIGEGIEKRGRAFYLRHAKRATNPAVGQLFTFLAKQEAEHSVFLKRLEKEEQKKTGDVKFKILVKKYRKLKKPQIFRGKLREDAGDIEVIIMSMNMERKSIEFYKRGKKLAKISAEKVFFQRLVEFEEEHYEWLKDMLDNLTYAKIES
ncbi:MAG: ferritin family protein [Candidatus Aenigmatarchaeota archaeon]